MKCPNGEKVCYRDEKEAKEAKKTLKFKKAWPNKDWETVKVYECPHCKRWHLTSTGY